MHARPKTLLRPGGLIVVGMLVVHSAWGWASNEAPVAPPSAPSSIERTLEMTRGELVLAQLQLERTGAILLAYNALHLVVFLGLGSLASWLVALSERYPAALYLILFPLIFVAAHLSLALSIFAQPLLGAAGIWQIGAGSLTAAVLMGWYLWSGHPVLRRELRDIPLGDVPEED